VAAVTSSARHLDLKLTPIFCLLAVEAGGNLTGKIIIQVKETLDPTNLTLEVDGKEKTTAFDDSCADNQEM
jgi:hypothetical protein